MSSRQPSLLQHSLARPVSCKNHGEHFHKKGFKRLGGYSIIKKGKLPKRLFFSFFALLLIGMTIYFFGEKTLCALCEWVVLDEKVTPSDAVVVLNTGPEYFPRLIEAADLYRKGLTDQVVINGNRKSDVFREIEAKGFKRCCPWYEDSLRILSMFGVPREKVISLGVEDAYDTTTEAAAVGKEVIRRGYRRIIITTSKYHTRRAKFIWKRLYGNRLSISSVSAKTDPFDPNSWWRDGRQIRWVLSEYGAWVFYCWKRMI